MSSVPERWPRALSSFLGLSRSTVWESNRLPAFPVHSLAALPWKDRFPCLWPAPPLCILTGHLGCVRLRGFRGPGKGSDAVRRSLPSTWGTRRRCRGLGREKMSRKKRVPRLDSIGGFRGRSGVPREARRRWPCPACPPRSVLEGPGGCLKVLLSFYFLSRKAASSPGLAGSLSPFQEAWVPLIMFSPLPDVGDGTG